MKEIKEATYAFEVVLLPGIYEATLKFLFMFPNRTEASHEVLKGRTSYMTNSYKYRELLYENVGLDLAIKYLKATEVS